MKISFQQARKFLENITNKDSVMIFTHKDLDGFASGSLLYNFCKKKGAKVDVRIINYGESKISDTNLENCNKIILADLGPSSVSEDLAKLQEKEILYTDHHQEDENYQLPDFVLELRTTNEGYIPSSRTCYELTEQENKELYWVGVAGVVSDMGHAHSINKEFIEKFYSNSSLNHEEMFEYVKKLNNVIVFFSASIESFYKIASIKNPEDIKYLKEYYEPIEQEFNRLEQEFQQNKENFNQIIYFYMESKYALIKSSFITGISSKEKEKVYIFCTPKHDSIISISGRNQSREYDVCQILKDCLNGLKDGFAGGHKVAAGGQVDRVGLTNFKERLKQINIEEYKIWAQAGVS